MGDVVIAVGDGHEPPLAVVVELIHERAGQGIPSEDVVAILLTQGAWTSPIPPAVYRDFWKAAYQAINV